MTRKNRTIFNSTIPMWKAREMIDALGGVAGLTEKLMKKGFSPPGPDTVQGWISRNRIPGAWSPAVFALAMDAKLIDTPMDAIIRDAGL